MINNVIDGFKFREALAASYAYLKANKELVNDLNVFPVPDGDTGTNMCLTMESAYKKTLEVTENSVSKVAKALSMGSLMGARGNSGVILSQIFRGFYEGVKNYDVLDTYVLAKGLYEAAQVAYKAVMKPTEGTILTVARETGDFARANYSKTDDVVDFLNLVIKAANESLQKTPELLPVLKQAGVVDAGGQGYLTLLTGAFKFACGEKVELDLPVESSRTVRTEKVKAEETDIEFGYCTEFMVVTDDMNGVNYLRTELAKLGDCLLVVGAEEIIKVHVHTNHPGTAIEHGLSLGALKDLKIENMRYQHEEKLLKDELKSIAAPKAKYGLLAISMGEGITEYIKSIGIDLVIEGGQTMNPSTSDILEGVDKLNADNIIIFPNNKNIILAAEQAASLSDKSITVVPTTSIPECVSSLLSFDKTEELDVNISAMKDAMSGVKTGQITKAVRDTVMDGIEIKKDEYIGISGKKIVSSETKMEDATIKLISTMVDDDSSLITIFYGEDVSSSETELLQKSISEKYDYVDVELINGKQPVYNYVIAVE